MSSKTAKIRKSYAAPALRRAAALAQTTAVAKTISGEITKDSTT
jgi:hypothetical protein